MNIHIMRNVENQENIESMLSCLSFLCKNDYQVLKDIASKHDKTYRNEIENILTR